MSGRSGLTLTEIFRERVNRAAMAAAYVTIGRRRSRRCCFYMYFALLRSSGSEWGFANAWYFRRVLVAVATFLVVVGARAEEPADEPINEFPGETERALPGLIQVGLPTPSHATVVVAGGLGYGWMDETSVLDGGHRFRGTVGAAYSVLPYLTVGADLQGRMDRFPDGPDGPETNLYGEPRVTARYFRQATPRWSWGIEWDARWIGAEAPSIDFSATSPSMRGLLAMAPWKRTWFGAHLGFHLDRSAEAVPDPSVVSAPDKRTLGASSWNAVQWGLGTSHRFAASKTEWLAEASGQWLVGSDTPRLSRSPYQLSLGARHPLSREFSLLATTTVALSKRPLTLTGDDLLPIEPRVSAAVVLIWRIGGGSSPPQPAPQSEPEAKPEPPPAPAPPVEPAEPPPPVKPRTAAVTGTVVDEGGRPLPDAEVTVITAEGEELTARTFADGRFEVPDVPEKGAVELRVATPGYDEATVVIEEGQERTREVVLRPSVPAGQVRGRVLDLQGNALAATITVTPGDHVVVAQSDGSFELELAPGRYTVKFEEAGFTTQLRRIEVLNRGVVILNIALTR